MRRGSGLAGKRIWPNRLNRGNPAALSKLVREFLVHASCLEWLTAKAAKRLPAGDRRQHGITPVFAFCYSCRVLRIHKSAWLLVLLSAGLQIVVFPLPNLYFLGWAAVAPLLVALLRAREPDTLQLLRRGQAAARTARCRLSCSPICCGILWYAGTCYWIYNTMRQYGGVGTARRPWTPVSFLSLSGSLSRRLRLAGQPAGECAGGSGSQSSRSEVAGPIPLLAGSSSGPVCLGGGGAGAHSHHRISLGSTGHLAGGQYRARPHCHRDRRVRPVF